MFSWLIESIVGLAVEVMEFIAHLFMDALGNDLSTFFSLLPADAIRTSFSVMQGLGVGLVIIIISWQLFKTFGLPIGIEAENPIQIVWKSILSIFCIIFSWQIFNLGFTVINGGGNGGPMAAINGLESNFLIQEKFSLSDFSGKLESAASSVSFVFSSGTATAMMVVGGIMIILVLFNLIKLLLELLERYCLLGVLALTSPLGFSTLCSSSTGNIFKAWVRMCVGQYIMLLLNMWSIRIFLLMAGNGMNSDNFLIWMFFLLAFSKIAQKLDTYMQRLGLEVGTTGSSLLGELLAVRSAAGVFTRGSSSPMGTSAQGGLAERGASMGAALLRTANLTGVGTAALQGAKLNFNKVMNGSSGNVSEGRMKLVAGTMAAAGAVKSAGHQFAKNFANNNMVSRAASQIKYNNIKNQFDKYGPSSLSSENCNYTIANKMMSDTKHVYSQHEASVAAGRALFGDSIGPYNLSSVQNASIGNGAFKFNHPSTGESVTVMKTNEMTQRVKENAAAMYQHGQYTVVSKPMNVNTDSYGNGNSSGHFGGSSMKQQYNVNSHSNDFGHSSPQATSFSNPSTSNTPQSSKMYDFTGGNSPSMDIGKDIAKESYPQKNQSSLEVKQPASGTHNPLNKQ